MIKQFALALDTQRCSGCFACVVACQDQNDIKAKDAAFRQVVQLETVADSIRISFLSIACFHCGDAPCMRACPTGAIFRHDESGLVDVNRDLCIGCHSCELVCPFGAPKFAADGRMAKCDLCRVRIASGMEPACMHICPTHALNFGLLADLVHLKAQKAGIQILKAVPASTR